MSTSSNARAKLVDHASAAKLFSELAYEEEYGLFYMEDGMIGFAVLMNPLTAADQSTLNQMIGTLSQDWPKNSFMQWTLLSSPDIERNLRRMIGMRENANELLFKTVMERASFLREGTASPIGDSTGPLVRDHRLILTAKIPCENPPTRKSVKAAYKLKTSVMSALQSTGLAPKPLTASEYTRIMKTVLNWGEDASWRNTADEKVYNEGQMLRDQFLDIENGLTVSSGGLQLGKKHIRTLSVKQYPEYVHLGVPSSYIADPKHGNRGLKNSFMLTASIYFPDSENAREAMTSKRNWLIKQAQGPMLKFVPKMAAQYHSFNALFEALDDGDRAIQFNLSLAIFADSEEEANNDVSNAKTYYRTIGMQLMEDKFFHLPIFLNALPFGADQHALKALNRYTTMATRHAVRLLPFLGDWKGTGTPTMQFISRTGQLMSVDLFDSNTNFNGVVAAQSGAGKSFLTNEKIVSYLSMGERVWVIDVGRSYEKLSDALGGQFMVFSDDSSICLNPFDVVKDYNEEVNMLIGLLTAMAAPNEKLSDLQLSRLRKVLNELWQEKGPDTTIDLIAKQMIEMGQKEDDRRISDVGHQLFPFTSAGEFGRWFNGKNNLEMNQNPFITLELEELKGKPELQQVVLLQLIYQIQQEMYLGERDQRKLLIIDEAWSLLASGSVAGFIETGYRRFRKYGGAAITITQSINDLYSNPTGVAIAENSANMYLLKQKGQTIDQVKREERLPLSDAGYDLLKTVHTQAGKYSECFFITEGGAGIGRLIVNRFQQLLYSTKHSEVQAIKNYQRQGKSLPDAIDAVVEDEKRAAEQQRIRMAS
jgi:conjugal transfer ATP-binding protein TraC